AIGFNMFYTGTSPVIEEDQSADDEARQENLVPVTDETPVFRNIFMKNITVTNSEISASFMGLPEMKLENVRLENSLLQAKKGITVIDGEGLEFVNVRVITEDTPLTIYNSQDIKVEGLSFEINGSPAVKVLGKSSNIQLDKKDFADPAKVSIGKGLENEVKLK